MFSPFSNYVEVEPISLDTGLSSDDKKFVEAAKVLSVAGGVINPRIKTGDIIFFRPHGFFETPEFEGKKHYVVRMHEDFILGIYHVGTE
jgi:hypothetical protein